MNREIKFKVWDYQNNCWAKESEARNSMGFEFGVNDYFFDAAGKKTIRWKFLQYTGKKDKFGVEVYDGDFDSDGNCVVWCDNCNGWQFAQLDIPTKEICIPCHMCDGNFFFEDNINDFEVIGNIVS
jgi:hypothetical protein